MANRLGLFFVAGMLAASLQGCGSLPPPAADADADAGPGASVRHRAADAALAMVGTPYAFGGAHPSSGFDCSGLVQFSFLKVGWRVPRSTEEQRRRSVAIAPASLQRGDLLFFDQDGKKNSHVALYLGDGRFVHAPSSAKATRTDAMSSAYWRRHFSEARRIEAPGR